MLKHLASTLATAALLTAPAQAQVVNLSLEQRANMSAEGTFEKGTYQTLRAIEKMMQTRLEYGIGTDIGAGLMFGRGTMPANKQRSADTFSKMIATFNADLDTARATLGKSTVDTAEPFEISINEIWLDVNKNAKRDQGEDALTLLGPMIPRELTRQKGTIEGIENATIRFDGADLAWLTAYTHVLSGMGEVVLAFDPTPVFADLLEARTALKDAPTIEFTLDQAAVEKRIADLDNQIKETSAKIETANELATPLRKRENELWKLIRDETNDVKRDELQKERQEISEKLSQPPYHTGDLHRTSRNLKSEKSALEQQLVAAGLREPAPYGRGIGDLVQQETIDTIYSVITTLKQQPDANHIQKAAQHWQMAIDQNRLFWAALERETDDDREWIPNAKQTSAVGLTVPAELAAGWQSVLDDAQALLKGELLIPHPLLPDGMGLSLAQYIKAPSPLDLTGWLHGRDAYPYAAFGPTVNEANWTAFSRAAGRNPFCIALMLN